MKLGPDSDRATGARRFGLELRRARAARHVTQRGLCATAGIGRSRIANWETGTSLPSVELAGRLADLLMWPRLREVAQAARQHPCDNCGRLFTVETPSPQRYCSLDCRRFRNLKVPGTRDLSRAVLNRRVIRLIAAVGAMCAGCEPSGLCRTPECPLQVAGVSSHPITRESVA